MPSLEDMARKGQQKLTQRINQPDGPQGRGRMQNSYRVAFERAVANYQASGMGPSRVAAYQQAYATIAAQNYEPEQRRWATNWLAKMQE